MSAAANSIIESIKSVVEKKLTSMGLELYELKYIEAGSRLILRVFIDKDDSVTVDDCEKASHEISILLDVENFSQMPYTLEVSSPGIDRPLITEKDFRRVVGNDARVHFRDNENKKRTVSGRLVACSSGNVAIETEKGLKTIPLPDITGGKVEIKI